MIKTTSRPVTGYEKIYIGSNERCQFAVEVSDPGLVPKIIRNLKHYILGFHLRLEDLNLVYHNDPINILTIPKNIKNVRQACEYVDSINFNYKDTFSIIAANENTVAINVGHLICDGGFFIEIFDKLLLDEPPPMKSYFPITTNDTFPEELSKITKEDVQMHQEWMSKLTPLRWSKNYKELQKKVDNDTKCKYYPIEIPAKDTQFFKSKMNLTDLYMTSFALSIMGLNGKLSSNFGISNCVNIRQFLPSSKRDISNTQNTSEFSVIANNANSKMTIRELAKSFRSDLASKLKDGKVSLAAYQSLFADGYKYDNECCCFPELSNIGRFKVNEKYSSLINDMWVQQTMRAKVTEIAIAVLAFSKDKYGENTLVTRLQQPISVINDDDAQLLMKSIVHMMKDVPADVSVQDAYDELRRFQNNIRKE